MLLRHSNANLGHKRTKNFQPKLPPWAMRRAIKREDQALRLGLCEESYVPKLTDSQKEELTISFGKHNRSLLAAVSWSLRLGFCRIAASSKPRWKYDKRKWKRLTSKVDARPDRTCWVKTPPLLALESSRKSSFAARGLMSCRIVAKRKSAKQRCRKLACGQRLARLTSLRRLPEKYSGRMVRRSSG